MRRTFTLLTEGLAALCRVAVGLAFAVMIGAVLLQVLGRSGIGSAPVWTEELTRFGLLFLAACGAGLAFRSGDLVNVDLVSEALPGRGPWLMRLLSAVATLGFCLLLIGPSLHYVRIGAMQTSPALGWRMDWIHASVLVLLGTLAVFAAVRVLAMLTGTSDGKPEKPAEDEA
jgi:TRAP-type C4-dicarboxylate transport system permease small subunit